MAETRHIELSKEMQLPVDAVTQTFAFVDRRGAGKPAVLAGQRLTTEALLAAFRPWMATGAPP